MLFLIIKESLNFSLLSIMSLWVCHYDHYHPEIHPFYKICWGVFYLKMHKHQCKATWIISSVQSVSRVWLCNPMDCSTPSLPVHRQHPKLAQTHVHRVSDAIKPSHPLSSSSPHIFKLSQHQDLFKWVSSLHQVAKTLGFQLQHQSFQWTPRTDFL